MSSLRLGLAVVITVILQVAVVNHMTLFGVRPDLSVLLVVFLAMRRGPVAGTLVGFFLGMLQDLLVPATLGMNMLAKSILGFVVGKVSQNLAVPSIGLYGPILALAVLLHDFFYLLAYTRLDLGSFVRMFVLESIPTALYTAVIGILILAATAALGGSGQRSPRGEVRSGR